MKNKNRKKPLPAAAWILTWMLTAGLLQGQDGQWRGPNRDGKYPDTGLLKSWPAGGPELLLKIEGPGNGHSSAVVVDDKIYISGIRKDRDVLTRLDMKGKILWETDFGYAWNNTNTPLYRRGEIFTTSGYDAQGVMIRLSEDGKSAEVKWHNNILDVHHGGVVEVDGYLYGALCL